MEVTYVVESFEDIETMRNYEGELIGEQIQTLVDVDAVFFTTGINDEAKRQLREEKTILRFGDSRPRRHGASPM